ncbi:sialidase-3-like [Anneissia japonica]|uniref:sialidase-3-like n=1 Tax=Anneissia japonica TaxID=1529436 RepID=UPI0014256FBD|nr:sialidase-3-like [Anneissia japonica]
MTSNIWQTSATLVVPLDVFGSGLVHDDQCAYRHPAIVFLANKLFIVFCEKQVDDSYTIGLSRRGRLMEYNRVEWEDQQPILKKTDTRFQNLVPIVVDEKKGEIILLCVECTAPQGGVKLIQLKSSSGETWSDPIDVHLKWPENMQESAQLCCIGPGHGLCLQSGKLAVAGYIKFSEQVQLCVLTSDISGGTWEVVPISCSPGNAVFGGHAQLVEYAKDKVCITCSLKDCKQRFNVFSSDGCKTFHNGKLKPKLIEANPGCQAGIISIPSERKKGLSLIAFTNPAHESRFEKLSLRLSEDGGETWTDPCPPLIGRSSAACSDLAYYKGKDDRGLACVYENINITEGKKKNDYCILMQLISLDEIMHKKGK